MNRVSQERKQNQKGTSFFCLHIPSQPFYKMNRWAAGVTTAFLQEYTIHAVSAQVMFSLTGGSKRSFFWEPVKNMEVSTAITTLLKEVIGILNTHELNGYYCHASMSEVEP